MEAMMESRYRKQQLADMLVDWCEHDLEQLGSQRMTTGLVALEAVRTMVFTCKSDPTAWELLKSLVEGGDE
jgi:hypothetical protein